MHVHVERLVPPTGECGEVELGEPAGTERFVTERGEGRRKGELAKGMAVKEGVAADIIQRGGQRDLGERGASKKRRLAHGEERGG